MHMKFEIHGLREHIMNANEILHYNWHNTKENT